MPVYKLQYFNIRGRGETIRLIFHAAGQKFEDSRIEFKDWATRKNDFKHGKIPVLDIDNERLNQSVAIIQYLGSLFGLAGKTPLDAAKCHAMVENIRDLVLPLVPRVRLETDDAKRKTLIEVELAPEVKRILAMFEESAKANPDKSGYVIAGQLTYSDLELHTAVTTAMAWLGADVIKAYPHVQKHYELISSLPKLKDYLASRPKTLI